jgi:hypothetical protein
MILLMVKKLFALLLIATMLFCLVPGCTKDDGTAAETKDDSITTASDTTAKVTTAPETTKAPETTVKETEAPKEYEYTSVFKLDFTKMPDGAAPFTGNTIDNLRIEGGLLKGTGTSGDPFITYNGGDATFPADSVQEIRIKLKNYSSSYDFQFFFTTDTVQWSENASDKETLDWNGDDGDKNDWNNIIIDPTLSSDWTGTITNLRIDPSSAEGEFEIESIEFFTATAK